jgi:NAD(P)-dependent dehydrogenase (short-subunit alcohol dehydrogenase family)
VSSERAMRGKGESILVTGAGRRIGRAFAEALAADGWFVFVHYRSSREEAEDVAAAIVKAGGAATAIQADLAAAEQASNLVARCRAVTQAPPLTALVNSAAQFAYDFPTEFEPEQFRAHFETNVMAPAILARDLWSGLSADAPKDRRGCIVNLLDMKLFALNPDFYSYTASKAALHAATRMMAMAYAPRARVAGLAPGITLISGKQTEESFQRAHGVAPLGHSSTPEDLIAALRYILNAPAYTGQVLVVDGGQSLMGLPRDVAFLEDGAPWGVRPA